MNKPNATIVIPVLNEARSIGALLEALTAQDFPADQTEILVADGGSTDGTQQIVKCAQARFHRLRLIDNPQRTAAAGLNAGIAAAKGDIIIRMDGHSIFASHHVSRSVELLTTTDAACVGGPIEVRGRTSIGRAQTALTKTWMGTGGAVFRCGTQSMTWADTVFCGAWWRHHFDTLGGFDESLPCNQDDEFHFRTRESGGRILLDPSLEAVWHPRESLLDLARQYFRYGFHKIQVLRLHSACWRWRHLIPATFVATLLALTLGGFHSIAIATLLAHVIATIASVTRIGLTADKPALLAAPAVALTQHIAYGGGFCLGAVRALFVRRPQAATNADDEVARIRRVFEARDTQDRAADHALANSRWDTFTRHALPLMSSQPADWEILEIGCGTGGWFSDFMNLGVPQAQLTGTDLCEDRIETARKIFPAAHLQTTDSASQPCDDESIDIVVLSTVLSSIHDGSMRQQIASEAVRVLSRNGVIVVYDVRLPNPFNSDLHPLSPTTIEHLFAGHHTQSHRSTLLPPLTRWLESKWPGAYRLLREVPFLQSHTLTVIQKVPARAERPSLPREVAHV